MAFAGAIDYAFSGSSGLGIGHRKDPSSRWIFVPLIIIAVAFAWLPPHLDRLNRWTIDGDTVRYLGLIITAIGGFVRVATVFELGHRFSIFVALQPDHRLKTDGLLSFCPAPQLFGMFLAMAGWPAGVSEYHRFAFNSSDVRADRCAHSCRRRFSRPRIRQTISRLSTTHPLAIPAVHLLTGEMLKQQSKPLCLRGLTAGSLALETLQERRKQRSQTLLMVRVGIHFSSWRQFVDNLWQVFS